MFLNIRDAKVRKIENYTPNPWRLGVMAVQFILSRPLKVNTPPP
jgi:hypothetical protein